jgi:hypothetical protein
VVQRQQSRKKKKKKTSAFTYWHEKNVQQRAQTVTTVAGSLPFASTSSRQPYNARSFGRRERGNVRTAKN